MTGMFCAELYINELHIYTVLHITLVWKPQKNTQI